jgi:hypothetical protein
MKELAEWDSFYLIVGGAAGALIGLQFVVMTLLADRDIDRKSQAGHAFATPTITQFTAALLLSALVRMPFKTISPIGSLWGVIGIVGIFYTAIVIRRIAIQNDYKPVFEDWLFHAILPLIAYIALTVAAFTTGGSDNGTALFTAGGVTLLLLVIGIHNAWDTTTYSVFNLPKPDDTAPQQTDPPPENEDGP